MRFNAHHFAFSSKLNSTNDVMFRLVDNDASPTTELRSECMMITAR